MLVRDASQRGAEKRVDAVVDTLGVGGWVDRLEVLKGDILEKDFGLAAANAVLGRCCGIVHAAAYTGFDESSAELSRLANIEGTRHALALAARLRLPFFHVSTAYVAGRRRGWAREDELDLGQAFNNVYEQTKMASEKLVRAWVASTRLPAILLRPGIVVGDSAHGRMVRFNTLYDLMHAFEVLSRRLATEELRVAACPAATKNFVPADYFAALSWQIIDRAIPGTYHVTHPSPVSMQKMCAVFGELFNASSIRLVDESEFSVRGPTQAERLYRKAAAVYAPYLQSEPLFDRSQTDAALADAPIPAPVMDTAFFGRLLGYARAANWGRLRAHRAAPAPPEAPTSAFGRYFGTFLRGKLHQHLLPDLRTLTALFRVVPAEDPGAAWLVSIRDGVIAAISRAGQGGDCSFELDAPTFGEIVAGRLPPQQAFFQRRVEISGDIEIGLRLAAVLGAFFRQFPFPASDLEPCRK